ncbi:MAG: type II secretion system protein GspM [Pseudomonadota bacterium]
MVAYWRSLSSREQGLLLMLGVVAAATAFYFLLVRPVQAWQSEAETRLTLAKSDYALVATAAAAPRGSSGAKNPSQPLRPLIISSAARSNVTLNSINSINDQRVRVTISETEADAVFAWLAQLKNQQGVRAITADVARLESDATTVQATLTLEGQG